MKRTSAPQTQVSNEQEVFHILDRLHHTAEGYDGLPAWMLRLAAPVYARIIALLINRSVLASHVPRQWKIAIISPVAKIPQSDNPADYRPISITPVISRVVEKLLVRRYIYPAFNMEPTKDLLADQFAFRPTGSTTAAVISIIQNITQLLETNESVTLISLDFSKAFDTVRHSTMTTKLAKLNIPDEIYNWVVNFLKERGHMTKYAGRTSAILYINASIVQGSGLGPNSFAITASDLKTLDGTIYCPNSPMTLT